MQEKYGGIGTDKGFVMHDPEEKTSEESDYDYDFFDDDDFDDVDEFLVKARAVKAGISRTLEALFDGFMSRSMGEANFLVTGAMLLFGAKIISAQFIDTSFLEELNAVSFFLAIAALGICTFYQKAPANPIVALCIACSPAIIEIVVPCAVRGIDSDAYIAIANWAVSCGVGGAILGLAAYLTSDDVENEETEDSCLRRMLIDLAWGVAIGAVAAFLAEMLPYIAREIASSSTPSYLDWI